VESSTSRALAVGASEDEIAEVLLAIAPATGLGRVASDAPEVAAALGYDIDAALLDEPDDPSAVSSAGHPFTLVGDASPGRAGWD
jgi:hypothetical protein